MTIFYFHHYELNSYLKFHLQYNSEFWRIWFIRTFLTSVDTIFKLIHLIRFYYFEFSF